METTGLGGRAASYALAAALVAAALVFRLLLERFGILGPNEMRMTLFLFAIAASVWYLGTGPGVLAAVLSALAYDYFLRHSVDSFSITVTDLPFYIAFMLFALLVMRFTAVRRRFERELLQRTADLEQQSIILTERTRMTEGIHESLTQTLAMIVMQLADAEAKLGPAWTQVEKPLGTVRELAVESLAYARRSLTILQPSAPAAGLARAIRDVAESVGGHFPGGLDFAVTGMAVLLPATVEAAIAEIAREALTNAARHSSAERVHVDLAFREGGAVRLAVVDNGAGFDVAQVRSEADGLSSMQDRAARAGVALTFVTEPGAGTEVVASWSP